MVKRLFAAAVGVLVLTRGAGAQERMRIARLERPPVMDGTLTDPLWQDATVLTDFKNLHPRFLLLHLGDRRDGEDSDIHTVGNKGQYIYCSPQQHLIIVRTGIQYGIPSSRWLHLFRELADRY